MENKILRMEGISKSFPGVKALSDVDFSVDRGEVRCLIGANGAGKSTLMKILSGACQRDSGKIFINGKEMHVLNTQNAIQAGVAVIYQELSLIDSLTVAENIFLNNYKNVKNGMLLNLRFTSNFGRRLDDRAQTAYRNTESRRPRCEDNRHG